nr:serine/threonine-protein kinase tor [Quercus suber]
MQQEKWDFRCSALVFYHLCFGYQKNSCVLPALCCHLIQLLTYLEQSADRKFREESAKLLSYLIRKCERLILPYIVPIHKALVARLLEGTRSM